MSNLKLVLVLLLMTLGHASARHLMADTRDSRPKLVSSLEVGSPIPGLQELGLGGDSTSEGRAPVGIDCLLLVAFDPTCSQCWKSAQLRSETGVTSRQHDSLILTSLTHPPWGLGEYWF